MIICFSALIVLWPVAEQRVETGQIIRQAVQEYLERLEYLAEEEREREIFQQQRQELARQAAALVKEQAKL
jgi:hypothetical protein